MPVLLAMVFGLAGGAAGFLLGALLASIAASLFHMSNMEGAVGYLAACMGALTGLAGMVLTMVFTLRRHGVTSFAGVLGGTFGAAAGLAVVAAACFGLYYMSMPHYIRPGGYPVYLNFEIAPPPGGPAPDLDQWSTELHTDRNASIGYWKHDDHAQLDGLPVAMGHVPMYYRTSWRELVLYLPNQERYAFPIGLPGDPTAVKYRQWSPWRSAEAGFRIRYQVEETTSN
jgi:hypothetical protein